MAIWLIRAGKHGEYERKFITESYDLLGEDLKAELPLKRVWTVAAQEEE